jgi:hypothetical protein
MPRTFYDADSGRLYGDRGVEIKRRMPPAARRAVRILDRAKQLEREGMAYRDAIVQARAEEPPA